MLLNCACIRLVFVAHTHWTNKQDRRHPVAWATSPARRDSVARRPRRPLMAAAITHHVREHVSLALSLSLSLSVCVCVRACVRVCVCARACVCVRSAPLTASLSAAYTPANAITPGYHPATTPGYHPATTPGYVAGTPGYALEPLSLPHDWHRIGVQVEIERSRDKGVIVSVSEDNCVVRLDGDEQECKAGSVFVCVILFCTF